jgi:hypothetical protein
MVQAQLGLNDFCPLIIRSTDNGHTWHDERPIWSNLVARYSIFGSISSGSDGKLYFFGTRTRIDSPGEPNWCDATHGLKTNELIWARSMDEGHTWSEPAVIPSPLVCAAEAPGPMLIMRDGTWHACFAPYNTFDPMLVVQRDQIVLVSSSDEGRTWSSTSMHRFAENSSTGAEAWVVELSNRRLLGTSWNINQRDGGDFPNAYAISDDGGHTWSPTWSTGIFGQSTALSPLGDGSALFMYCRRREDPVGVGLAHVRPTDESFGILSNEIVWVAPQRPKTGNHAEWTQFTFGEPSATILEDSSVLVFFWCLADGAGSIRFVRTKSPSRHC